MTHPHRDLIIALLDDPTLEVEIFEESFGHWRHFGGTHKTLLGHIGTHPHRQFRLREKPKPDVVRYYMQSDFARIRECNYGSANLRLTFSADGVLKNAEVI